MQDEESGRKPKLLRSPVSPTKEEIEEHEATGHTIHRTWCGHCMRARGLHERHPSEPEQGKDERGLPIVSMDYFWMGRDSKNRPEVEPEGELPSLQVKDEYTGYMWCSVVPAKGADNYAVNFVIQCLEESGYRRLVLKSDNENSIKSLKEAVKKGIKTVEIVLEESKTGDSQANGACEVAVRETKRQIKAMKSSLEEKLGIQVRDRHPILAWVGRHADFMISRFRVGTDGRTPYERSRGRRWKRPSVTFGERVWFKPLKSYLEGPYDTMREGMFMGAHGRNGDALVMTKDGVIKGGSVKRMPEEKRWSTEDFDQMCGTPWKMRPQKPEDLDAPIAIAMPAVEPGVRLMPVPADRDSLPRNLYVKKADVEGNYTAGCEGCNAIQVGLPARAHSSECRTLVQQRLLRTEEGRARVLKAQKRKGEASADADEPNESVLRDGPDDAVEMAADAAIGQPEGRVGPLVRPDPVRRPLEEEGSSPGGAAKRQKSPEKRGQKREGEESHREAQVAEREEARGSNDPAPPAQGSEAPAAQSQGPGQSDMVSVLEANMFHKLESKKEIYEISQLLCSMGISKSDVAEIYNPERFTSKANLFGLRPGFAVDLMVSKNSKGDHWDLSKDTDQRELRRLLKKEKPLFLVGSPPCGPFSPLQNLSKYKRTDEENQQILEEGRTHLKVAVECYLEQHNHGRFFLHEHPKPSASWQEPEVERLASLPGVYKVESPMCKWEMVAEDQQGVGYVRKDTCWLTNSPEMAKCIEGKCEGGHRHVHLINGRARAAQTYPPKLVSAILDGIRRELRVRGELSTLAELTSGPSPDDTSNDQTESFVDETVSDYVDSVTSMPLDPAKVLEARKEEMKWVEKQQLWDVVPTTMCWEETNRPPITLKWVDRNKGDDSHPNYRSRLVVREVKKASKSLAEFESFSAMPPLESLKVLCALMVSKRTSKRNRPYKMMLIDISRAHFYGESKRRVFCTLPEGSEQEGACALLKRSMYGTLDAANIWQSTYVQLLTENNFRQCKAWPALFIHDEMDLRFIVHGDDFICLGDDEALKYLEECLKKKFEYRVDGLIGPERGDGTSMCVLNRVISYDKTTGVLDYEADPRHAEYIVKALNLEGCKPVSTPAEKQKIQDVIAAEEQPDLEPEQVSQYRSLTMRAAYLSMDRADLAEATKSLARHMQHPTEYAWGKLKRLGRYLSGHMRVVSKFRPQKMFNTIRVFCDSDHAGDLKTRRSTTGIVCMLGSCCVKHSSNLQSTVSLSSGESEFYALVKAGSVGLGLKAMLDEWKIDTELVLLSDSSAARGIVSRKGLGKTRHVQTRFLWIQEKVSTKTLKVEPVGTHQNLSDLCTKPLPSDAAWCHMNRMGQVSVEGRNRQAKQLVA